MTSIQKTLDQFSTISLAGLNQQAGLMNRIDTKYLLHEDELPGLFRELANDFHVLSIKEKEIFSYESVYFDTAGLDFYYNHNRGFKNRIKIRSRHYVDADLYFIEFKQRQGKNTRKFRCTTRSEDYGTVTPLVKDFTNDIHKALHNGEALNKDITPAISTKYQRVTLVNKYNEEKITIDFNIRFGQEREVNHPPKQSALPHLAIIELKTVEKRTATHEVFAKHGLEKAHGCSKYCLGHYFLGNVSEWDHFQNTINKAINLSHDREVSQREAEHAHDHAFSMK